MTWRQILLDYNGGAWNPDRLYPAWQLYTDSVYGRLVRDAGVENLNILSAG
jgi:hypothetical protein